MLGIPFSRIAAHEKGAGRDFNQLRLIGENRRRSLVRTGYTGEMNMYRGMGLADIHPDAALIDNLGSGGYPLRRHERLRFGPDRGASGLNQLRFNRLQLLFDGAELLLDVFDLSLQAQALFDTGL